MIYLFENPDSCPDALCEERLSQIPPWRRETVLQHIRPEDRKRSLLAFLLLQLALREEYGITEISGFTFGAWGKPFLRDHPVHFSLSHCRDAVACAVADQPVGIDAECVIPYSPALARRVCSGAEMKMLAESKNPAEDFIRLWTVKEAISKFEGRGISMAFEEIDPSLYQTETWVLPGTDTVLSLCRGKAGDPLRQSSPVMRYIRADGI